MTGSGKAYKRADAEAFDEPEANCSRSVDECIGCGQTQRRLHIAVACKDVVDGVDGVSAGSVDSERHDVVEGVVELHVGGEAECCAVVERDVDASADAQSHIVGAFLVVGRKADHAECL